MRPSIFPYPQELTIQGGTDTLPSDFNLLFDYQRNDEIFHVVDMFCDAYEKQTGKRCYPMPDYAGRRTISVVAKKEEALTGEAYTLTIAESGIALGFGEFWDWNMQRCLDEIVSCCNIDREKSGWVQRE